MTGIIISIEKKELTNIITEAVKSAITDLQLQKEPIPEEDLMTVDMVCEWLNMKPSTLYQKTHYKQIPFIKKGKRLYFSKQKLKAWLLEGQKDTKVQEQQQAGESLSTANKKRNKS